MLCRNRSIQAIQAIQASKPSKGFGLSSLTVSQLRIADGEEWSFNQAEGPANNCQIRKSSTNAVKMIKLAGARISPSKDLRIALILNQEREIDIYPDFCSSLLKTICALTMPVIARAWFCRGASCERTLTRACGAC